MGYIWKLRRDVSANVAVQAFTWHTSGIRNVFSCNIYAYFLYIYTLGIGFYRGCIGFYAYLCII